MTYARLTRDQAKTEIADLCARFDKQIATYKDGNYNETQVRRDFIDPFLKALGWDVDNQQGAHEQYREVVHEDSLEIEGQRKAPDYSCRIGGNRVFFVEAKKPSVRIHEDGGPAYQVRRYGWNGKLALSILTDFEEFAVYDCTKKPKPSDKAGTCRTEYFRYTEYLQRFDFLWDTFSHEGVTQGGLLRYQQAGAKKGTSTVDKEFLASLDAWRVMLAEDISSHRSNKELIDAGSLNLVVQQLLDRIIFLRICEDRGVEPANQLRDTIGTKDSYGKLLVLFHTADQKYNSGLFDFARDNLSQRLEVSDKVLKDIVKALYYPECPYEFSVLSVEILGSAYERFLGKSITLDSRQRAVIEEKPEVRKAGGVYYTPQYIVDYIVQKTLAPLVEGKTPEQVAQLKIVDQACGSGSFLLGAYQYLLDWHLHYYQENPRKTTVRPESGAGKKAPAKADALTPAGTLVNALRKQILRNNIFGVDLDAQAVEVTKLSLLLKCMEGETNASLGMQQSLFHDRVLPSIDQNIQCGNSLIDYAAQDLFGEEASGLNPFDWQAAFPQVAAQGGFDAVIGNPPYVRQETLGAQKDYFAQHYQVYHGVADLYTYFFERGLRLLQPEGRFGIIVANKWMRANYGEPLRRWLKGQRLLEIVDFGDLPVFEQATTYPCIFLAQKALDDPARKTAQTFRAAELKTLDFPLDAPHLKEQVDAATHAVDVSSLDDSGWSLAPKAQKALLDKLRGPGFVKLGDYVKGEIYYGIKTGLNEAFVIDDATRQALVAEDPHSAEVIKPFLAGRDVKRYAPPESGKFLILFPKGITNQQRGKAEPWNWLRNNYPAIAKHLKPFEEKGAARYDKGDYWWELRTCDYYAKFDGVKIIVPAIMKQGAYVLDRDGFYSNDKTTIIANDDLYLVGLLSSRVVDFFMHSISSTKQGGYFEYKPMYLEQLPIQADSPKAQRDAVVKKVEQMLALHRDLSQANPVAQDRIRQHIAVVDRELDALVYALYGLTPEEVNVVEGA
ncbi:MAG TPA: N-6 DNA methylase [Fibrobacteraceae bacterium]|nr:N-6 DNA methylase [Fibrobacteraceae bacterium]